MGWWCGLSIITKRSVKVLSSPYAFWPGRCAAVRNFLPAGEDPPSSAGAEERPPAHYLFFFDRAGRGKLRVSSHGTVAIGTLLGTGSLRSAAWAFARSILLSSAGRRTAAAAAALAARPIDQV